MCCGVASDSIAAARRPGAAGWSRHAQRCYSRELLRPHGEGATVEAANRRTGGGATPLALAISAGRPAIVKLVQAAGGVDGGYAVAPGGGEQPCSAVDGTPRVAHLRRRPGPWAK